MRLNPRGPGRIENGVLQLDHVIDEEAAALDLVCEQFQNGVEVFKDFSDDLVWAVKHEYLFQAVREIVQQYSYHVFSKLKYVQRPPSADLTS